MQDMEQIYEQYFEAVYKYLFCLTCNSDIAEELTQETFYRAVKKIHTFKEDCKISVWLCQIAKNLWYDGKIDDDKVKNQLILYCGVMFGVSGAVSGVRVLSTQLSKTALKKIPQKALTKTFWYPILKKIANFIGISLTKKTFAQGVSKAVPVIGGFISGGINFASMMPMANKLNDTLDKATFNYSDEEFNKHIEIIMNSDECE